MTPTDTLLFQLLAAHFVLDFAGQGDFMSRAKNHVAPVPGVSPSLVLAAHAYLHGFAVGLLTGSPALGLAEFLCHAVIDRAKCAGHLSFEEDQLAHILLKFVWAVLYGTMVA